MHQEIETYEKEAPELQERQEAEGFVATADLSDYGFSDMVPVWFELKRKDKTVSLRLPEQLLEEVRAGDHPGAKV